MAGRKRPKHFDYDLVIIGSGAGGGVAAHAAIELGKKVAIIEQGKIGGECPNTACVPTKALLRGAEIYHEATEVGSQFGIKASGVTINMNAMKKWKDLAVRRTGTGIGNRAFTADGIAVLKGHAHFLSPHEVSTGDKRVTAKQFLIATGTKDIVPPIEGLASAGYITHAKAINMTRLPKSMLVIGGGAVGVEFTHLYNRLGVEVIQAEFTPRLLSREEPEASELIRALFERRGVNVLTGAEVFKVEKDRAKKVVHVRHGGKELKFRVDEVLLAAGKLPNVDLGLENAGVEFAKHGIKTNPMMQTTAKHIFAAGDVVGPYALKHMASYQSKIAAHNMFHREKIVTNYKAVPRVVFTEPEIASVGMTEAEARKRGLKIRVNAVPVSIIGRANTSNQSAGFVKIIASRNGVLIGGTVVCPHAGEVLHELSLAIQNGLKARDVAATIHAFPTWSEALRIACSGLK